VIDLRPFPHLFSCLFPMNFTTVSPISTDSVTVLRLSVREEWIFLTVPRQNEFGEMVEGQRHGIALGLRRHMAPSDPLYCDLEHRKYWILLIKTRKMLYSRLTRLQ
jgi:hypothetical protein